MEVLLYIVAMFAGSLQYDPQTFWATIALIVVLAVLAYYVVTRLLGLGRTNKPLSEIFSSLKAVPMPAVAKPRKK